MLSVSVFTHANGRIRYYLNLLKNWNMETELLKNVDDTREVGIKIWDFWADMWNGNLTLAEIIISKGFRLHIPNSASDAKTLYSSDDVKQLVSQIRGKYAKLHYYTVAGPFIDVNQQVVSAHWEATATPHKLHELFHNMPDKLIKIEGTDILKFRDNKIFECWTMNNLGKN